MKKISPVFLPVRGQSRGLDTLPLPQIVSVYVLFAAAPPLAVCSREKYLLSMICLAFGSRETGALDDELFNSKCTAGAQRMLGRQAFRLRMDISEIFQPDFELNRDEVHFACILFPRVLYRRIGKRFSCLENRDTSYLL